MEIINKPLPSFTVQQDGNPVLYISQDFVSCFGSRVKMPPNFYGSFLAFVHNICSGHRVGFILPDALLDLPLPSKALLERYINAADEELGPACVDPWVEWCRQVLRQSHTQAKR